MNQAPQHTDTDCLGAYPFHKCRKFKLMCNVTINFTKLHCCSKLVMAQENAVSLGRLVGTIKDQQDHSHKSSAQQNEGHPEASRAIDI